MWLGVLKEDKDGGKDKQSILQLTYAELALRYVRQPTSRSQILSKCLQLVTAARLYLLINPRETDKGVITMRND